MIFMYEMEERSSAELSLEKQEPLKIAGGDGCFAIDVVALFVFMVLGYRMALFLSYSTMITWFSLSMLIHEFLNSFIET